MSRFQASSRVGQAEILANRAAEPPRLAYVENGWSLVHACAMPVSGRWGRRTDVTAEDQRTSKAGRDSDSGLLGQHGLQVQVLTCAQGKEVSS